jgi:hypothetical protein
LSVIGTITWRGVGPAVTNGSTQWTFKTQMGAGVYEFGGGRWIQVEGSVAWNFTNAASLIYAANVRRNALDGMQGYATSGASRTGCFYALRERQ